MTDNDTGHHGIPESEVATVIHGLGITEHTAEDCRLSRTLHATMRVPVVVDGSAVYVLQREAWERYRLDAATRRRLVLAADGQLPPSEVNLQPWGGQEAQ